MEAFGQTLGLVMPLEVYHRVQEEQMICPLQSNDYCAVAESALLAGANLDFLFLGEQSSILKILERHS